VEGKTIEKYMILQRIEKVKELLVYDELNLNEISYKLGYSSVAHLSRQFKSVTGLTPSHYKKVREEKRKPLDQV
jgi:AraC-like DNA-binding protein